MSGLPSLSCLSLALTLSSIACRPHGFASQAWIPPQNPGLLNTLPPNQELKKARPVDPGHWNGPEEIAIDASGRVYAGSLDGSIHRTSATGAMELFAKLPGQVLGLDFDLFQNLYACVDGSGLWRVNPQGKAEQLFSSFQGQKFGLLDDVKVARSGLVYISEATSKYAMGQYLLDILEGVERGRVFQFNPGSGEIKLLLDRLGFANGLSLADDDSYLLVTETSRYRIRKFQLTGPDAGKDSIFMDNLPGFPDGLSRENNGHTWVAMISLRSPLLDTLHPKPFFKDLLAGLPEQIMPKARSYGLVAAFDQTGRWLQGLHDPEGQSLPGITSVEERADQLWFGSLHGNAIFTMPSPLK